VKLVKVEPKFLQWYIRYFYFLKSESKDSHVSPPHRRLPDGNLELMLNFGGPIYHSNPRENTIPAPDSSVANIVGLFDGPFLAEHTGKIHLAGVFFKPEASTLLLKDRSDLYRRTFSGADLIFHSEMLPLMERLEKISSPLETAQILESFLLPKFTSQTEPRNFDYVQKAVKLIQARNGNLTQKELLEAVYLSKRHFRRIFAEHTGFSPKEYARLVRVRNVLRLLKSGKLFRRRI